MMRHTLVSLMILTLTSALGCAGASFQVKSDPIDAEVFVENPKTGMKKSIGKTPVEVSPSTLKEVAGPEILAGEYFNVIVEKKGFLTQRQSVPSTRFGTLLTSLEVKMKEGEDVKQAKIAGEILDRLFAAQKFALKKEYERAQIEIDRVIAEYPEFPRALSMRASIYFVQGKFAESIKWYEQALKYDPKMEEAIKMIARAKQGRVPASKKGGNP
jgi:tetratricopeptide (TPR) repeat protein